MTVIYLDSVFLLNAGMDYLLCLLTARLAGITLCRRRYILAALLGGTYAAASFFPNGAFLSTAPVKAAVGLLMALIAYGGETHLLRLALLLFGLSCAMAGCMIAFGFLTSSSVSVLNGVFYADVGILDVLLAVVMVYLLLTLVFHAAARHGIRRELIPVRVALLGRVANLTALCDTGNELRDPINGMQILIVTAGGLTPCLSRNIRCLLSPQRLDSPADLLERLNTEVPELKPKLIPYYAVGKRGGLLLGIRTEWVEIDGTKYPEMTIALSPTELGSGYTALWGGEVRRGGRNEAPEKFLAVAEKAVRADSCHSLYRRK